MPDGGLTVFVTNGDVGPTGFAEPEEYHLGNLQAGIFLGVVAAVIVGIGVVLFAKRDMH